MKWLKDSEERFASAAEVSIQGVFGCILKLGIVRSDLTLGAILSCFLLLSGCKNEPYGPGSFYVRSVQDNTGKLIFRYFYQENKLVRFTKANLSGIIISRSEFYYSGDMLTSVISDSTATGYSITMVYPGGSLISSDSTWRYNGGIDTLVSSHVYDYDGQGQLVTIHSIEWEDTVLTENEYNLTWLNGNVSALITYSIEGSTKEILDSMVIEYDQKRPIYFANFVFLYTLPFSESYRLSANNPVLFKVEGEEDREYTYSFNEFDYPVIYKDHLNRQFEMSYILAQ